MGQQHVNALEASAEFSRRLRKWYRKHARDLPWRRTRDPYQIWLSEIMLQQTTVAVVRQYFERFLSHFPDVESLARAHEIDVLRLWAGLGYYRRARSLHAAAQQVCLNFKGRFPEDPKLLRTLPGLGRYTANAIACFAFGKRVPILEANTARVLRRVFSNAVNHGKEDRELWRIAEALLPKKKCAEHNYALMELGALVCKPRSPECGKCPISRFCRAYRDGGLLEVTSKRRDKGGTKQVRWHWLAFVRMRPATQILLVRFDEGEWHAGLYGLPRFNQNGCHEQNTFSQRSNPALNFAHPELGDAQHLGGVCFYVTNHRVFADVWLQRVEDETVPQSLFPGKNTVWVSKAKLIDLPIASPYWKALTLIFNFLEGATPNGQQRTHS